SPASMPTRRKTSSKGAPKRNAIRLDRMPVRTSKLPSNMARLTASSELITRFLFRYRKVSRPEEQPETLPLLIGWSKCHLVAALEGEDFACLVRGCDLKPETFEDLAHLSDLLGVGCRELPGTDPEGILHADAHVAAHGGSHRCYAHLVGTRAEHRPMIVVAKKTIGRALHHHDIFRMCPDPAEDSEHRLHEQRWLHQAAIEEMPQRVEMTDVVAFDLETRAVSGAGCQNVLDVGEGILEHALLRIFEIGLFPIVFEFALVTRD